MLVAVDASSDEDGEEGREGPEDLEGLCLFAG